MDLELITLEGTPREIGRQHGTLLRERVHGLAEERLRLCMNGAQAQGRKATRDDCLALAKTFLPIQQEYAPAVHEEFVGLAEGAKIAPELLLIGNGYTDYKDVLQQRPDPEAQNCTSFLVKPQATRDGRTYAGQNWDMHATAEAFVIACHRKPKGLPQTWTVTTTGCLALTGINEHGVAIGNNNLVPTDARPGVIYLAMIHNALNQTTLEAAVGTIVDAPRASGHNYYLAAPGGQIADVETTAERSETIEPVASTFVHANHCHTESFKPLHAPVDTSASTWRREQRLAHLLAEAAGTIDRHCLRRCLSDHEGGAQSVCVHGRGSAGKTCATIIMSPDERKAWANVGNPCENAPTELAFR